MGIKIEGNTKVSFSVKLLIGILLGLSTLATIGYFDIVKKQEEQKKYFEERLEKERENFRIIIRDEFSYIRRENSSIKEDITTIRENIARILARDRNERHNSRTIDRSARPSNEEPPSSF